MNYMDQDLLIVYTTCPPDKAESIAETLVQEHLAACVNILPARSVYFWESKLCRDEESLLLIKCRKVSYARLEAIIKSIHPYQLPEIVAVKAEDVQKDYYNWVCEQTKYIDDNANDKAGSK